MGISFVEDSICNSEILYMNINESVIKTENNHIKKIKKDFQYKIRDISRDKAVECTEIVAGDRSEVKIIFSGLKSENIYNIKRIKLKGLDEDANYINTETKEVFSGGALMNYGINIIILCGDNYDRVNLKRV